MTLLEQLQAMPLMGQGLFVALAGLSIVFLVLGLFYATIKLIGLLDRSGD